MKFIFILFFVSVYADDFSCLDLKHYYQHHVCCQNNSDSKVLPVPDIFANISLIEHDIDCFGSLTHYENHNCCENPSKIIARSIDVTSFMGNTTDYNNPFLSFNAPIFDALAPARLSPGHGEAECTPKLTHQVCSAGRKPVSLNILNNSRINLVQLYQKINASGANMLVDQTTANVVLEHTGAWCIPCRVPFKKFVQMAFDYTLNPNTSSDRMSFVVLHEDSFQDGALGTCWDWAQTLHYFNVPWNQARNSLPSDITNHIVYADGSNCSHLSNFSDCAASSDEAPSGVMGSSYVFERCSHTCSQFGTIISANQLGILMINDDTTTLIDSLAVSAQNEPTCGTTIETYEAKDGFAMVAPSYPAEDMAMQFMAMQIYPSMSFFKNGPNGLESVAFGHSYLSDGTHNFDEFLEYLAKDTFVHHFRFKKYANTNYYYNIQLTSQPNIGHTQVIQLIDGFYSVKTPFSEKYADAPWYAVQFSLGYVANDPAPNPSGTGSGYRAHFDTSKQVMKKGYDSNYQFLREMGVFNVSKAHIGFDTDGMLKEWYYDDDSETWILMFEITNVSPELEPHNSRVYKFKQHSDFSATVSPYIGDNANLTYDSYPESEDSNKFTIGKQDLYVLMDSGVRIEDNKRVYKTYREIAEEWGAITDLKLIEEFATTYNNYLYSAFVNAGMDATNTRVNGDQLNPLVSGENCAQGPCENLTRFTYRIYNKMTPVVLGGTNRPTLSVSNPLTNYYTFALLLNTNEMGMDQPCGSNLCLLVKDSQFTNLSPPAPPVPPSPAAPPVPPVDISYSDNATVYGCFDISFRQCMTFNERMATSFDDEWFIAAQPNGQPGNQGADRRLYNMSMVEKAFLLDMTEQMFKTALYKGDQTPYTWMTSSNPVVDYDGYPRCFFVTSGTTHYVRYNKHASAASGTYDCTAKSNFGSTSMKGCMCHTEFKGYDTPPPSPAPPPRPPSLPPPPALEPLIDIDASFSSNNETEQIQWDFEPPSLAYISPGGVQRQWSLTNGSGTPSGYTGPSVNPGIGAFFAYTESSGSALDDYFVLRFVACEDTRIDSISFLWSGYRSHTSSSTMRIFSFSSIDSPNATVEWEKDIASTQRAWRSEQFVLKTDGSMLDFVVQIMGGSQTYKNDWAIANVRATCVAPPPPPKFLFPAQVFTGSSHDFDAANCALLTELECRHLAGIYDIGVAAATAPMFLDLTADGDNGVHAQAPLLTNNSIFTNRKAAQSTTTSYMRADGPQCQIAVLTTTAWWLAAWNTNAYIKYDSTKRASGSFDCMPPYTCFCVPANPKYTGAYGVEE